MKFLPQNRNSRVQRIEKKSEVETGGKDGLTRGFYCYLSFPQPTVVKKFNVKCQKKKNIYEAQVFSETIKELYELYIPACISNLVQEFTGKVNCDTVSFESYIFFVDVLSYHVTGTSTFVGGRARVVRSAMPVSFWTV